MTEWNIILLAIPEALVKDKVLSIGASVGLKEDDSSNGKDVGHREQ